MFKAELTNHKIIKSAFESIVKIVDEITLTMDSEGIHLKCLDKTHITFITMDLNKTLFDEYQCDTPEKAALDCEEFMKIMKTAKNDDILSLSIDENNLIIIFNGNAVRKFKIRFIDLEYDNPTPPDIVMPCNIQIPSNLLKEYIGNMEIFSDKLNFIVDENYLIINTDAEFGDAEIKYLHGEKIDTCVKSTFSIPKLQDILKANQFSKELLLDLGEDMPIRVTYTLPANDGKLEYLLAPRLERD